MTYGPRLRDDCSRTQKHIIFYFYTSSVPCNPPAIVGGHAMCQQYASGGNMHMIPYLNRIRMNGVPNHGISNKHKSTTKR